MVRSFDDVKKMILQEFNSRTNDFVRGKIDFNKHADVLDGIARTYMYYVRNFPDKIDSSKIDGSDRFGRMLNKSVPDNMADLYLGRLLLNLLEIGETTESKGLCGSGGVFFDKSSMDRQIKYWKKDVSFSKQDLDILKNNENMVTKNLNDKVVIHELSHMSAIFAPGGVGFGGGFSGGSNISYKQTYASRLEEVCAESTALNVTHQKIPSTQKIKVGNDGIKIGCYNPESSNFAISSFIELAPFAFGYKELEMGRLMSPVSYMKSLNAEYSAFARSGGTFAGRIQEDFKAITDNREYGRLSKLQADFIKIGMTRISNQNYLNTCSENQFKRDVGYLLKVDNLLFRYYENNQQLRQTENIDAYTKAMASIENIFNNLKSNRNMFANYASFDEFKQEGLLAFANERRVALGLSPVTGQTQPTSQPQATGSRPAMPPTPQSQSGNRGQQQQGGNQKPQAQGNQSQPQGNQNPQVQPQAPVSGAYANLDGKIDFLNSLVFVPKTKSDFAQELSGKSGVTREDLSCCYAMVNNSKRNVADLTYKEIEKTLFEIVNIPDFNEAKRLAVKYGSLLRRVNYSSSFGTAARSLLERDKIRVSNLDNKSARVELLRDFGAYGDSIDDSEIICKYIKMSNNDTSPMTNVEQSKVLLKMQDNYDKFAFAPKPKAPQNFEKLIDASKFPKGDNINLVQKTDQEIQQEESLYRGYHNYTFKSCPLTIADGNGGKQDIWNLGANDIINRLTIAIVSGDNNEIRKMRIICENMKGHFNPSYGEMAKLTKVINDYWQLSKNPDVDKALDALKDMAMYKYREAYTIAQFNAQNAGKPQATYADMVDVFKELQKQKDLLKQNQSQGMTI